MMLITLIAMCGLDGYAVDTLWIDKITVILKWHSCTIEVG